MIEIRDFNLRKMDLSQNYKLYSSEMFKGTIDDYFLITAGTAATTVAINNIILNSFPEETQLAGLAAFITPVALISLYRSAIELIKANKKNEALELLKTLKKALNDHKIEVDFSGFEDLHRISVPDDLTSEENKEENFDNNYFWFRDESDKIQVIYQERDNRRKVKRFNYYLLEESDEELKYIRRIAR